MSFIVSIDNVDHNERDMAELFGATIAEMSCFINRRKNSGLPYKRIVRAIFARFDKTKKYQLPDEEPADLSIIDIQNAPFIVEMNGKRYSKKQFGLAIGEKNIKNILDEGRIRGKTNVEILTELLIKNGLPTWCARIVDKNRVETQYPFDEMLNVTRLFRQFIEYGKDSEIYHIYMSLPMSCHLIQRSEEMCQYLESNQFPPSFNIDKFISHTFMDFKTYTSFAKLQCETYRKSTGIDIQKIVSEFFDRIDNE